MGIQASGQPGMREDREPDDARLHVGFQRRGLHSPQTIRQDIHQQTGPHPTACYAGPRRGSDPSRTPEAPRERIESKSGRSGCRGPISGRCGDAGSPAPCLGDPPGLASPGLALPANRPEVGSLHRHEHGAALQGGGQARKIGAGPVGCVRPGRTAEVFLQRAATGQAPRLRVGGDIAIDRPARPQPQEDPIRRDGSPGVLAL